MFAEGRDVPDAEDGVLFDVDGVGPRFFDVLGVPMVDGRPFDDDDVLDRPRVAVINQAFARRFWGERSPLGETLRFLGESELVRIVGVARDHKTNALTEPPTPRVFVPLEQWPRADAVLLARVDTPTIAAPALEAALAALPDAPRSAGVQPYAEVLDQASFAPRIGARLLGTFGGLALLLAAIGLHGVMAYNVRLRTRELGIRMALGAHAATLFRMVITDAMRLVAMGIALGIVGGVVLETLLADLLFEVPLLDPLAFGGATLVLSVIAVIAAGLPAREATRVDPTVAMRHG